jgi:hypothetical protein
MAAAMMLASPTGAAAATLSITSQGVSVVDLKSAQQADGTIAQQFNLKAVQVNTDGDLKGETWGSDCMGGGLVDAAGNYSGWFRCTVNVSAEDAFTFQVDHDRADGSSAVITGGKGKFKDATGTIEFAYTWGDTVFGDRLTWTSKTAMSLP